MQNNIYSTGTFITLIKFHPEKYHIQCGYFWSLKKKVPKRDKKGTTFFEGQGSRIISCLNEENIIEPIKVHFFTKIPSRKISYTNTVWLLLVPEEKGPKRDEKGITFFEKGDQNGTSSWQKRDPSAQSRFMDHILFE